jgi:hypothetical protein
MDKDMLTYLYGGKRKEEAKIHWLEPTAYVTLHIYATSIIDLYYLACLFIMATEVV